MNFLKTHWPAALHAIAIGVLFLDPSVSKALQQASGGPYAQYAGTGLVIWAEIMRWFKSPRQ